MARRAKRNHTKEITSEEIMCSTDRYLARRLEYETKREQKSIESGNAPRKLITCEETGIPTYARYAQQVLEEGSDDEMTAGSPNDRLHGKKSGDRSESEYESESSDMENDSFIDTLINR